jgi:hypothetical protein
MHGEVSGRGCRKSMAGMILNSTEQCKQWCCGMFFFGWVGTAQAILTITGPPPLGEVALNLQDLQLVSLTILSNMRKIAKLDCIDVLGYSVDELGYPNHMTHTHAHIHARARTHTHTLTHTNTHGHRGRSPFQHLVIVADEVVVCKVEDWGSCEHVEPHHLIHGGDVAGMNESFSGRPWKME